MANSERALAIDLDGTLLVGEDLSPRNRDAVRAASDAGYHVIIATARWRQLAERVAVEIGLPAGLVIACSGAQVYCRSRQADIFDARLPAEFTNQLYEICNANRCIASATVDSHTMLKIDQDPGSDYHTDEMKWVTELPAPDQMPRIATVQGSATIELVREMHKDWAGRVNIFDSIGPTGRIVITITSGEADKGVALERACTELSIAPSGVIAFGDADNDIMMFERAGESVAMGQAADEVKNAATYVTADHREDGVAAFIESHLL